jgi:four helix bundle protein
MRQNLESRLIEFSSSIISFTKNLIDDDSSKLLTGQLLRSGTSSALNYGEAQNAQSKKDFIHKVSIVLKELRESHINLQIIKKSELYIDKEQINKLLKENDKLLAIFTATILTAKKNL